MSLPVFTGFETSAQMARADAQARNAEEALRAGRLAVALVSLEEAVGTEVRP